MTISVIIPCYNAERYLAQTIRSVLAQTRPASEIILVDDGSTDGSPGVARSFGDRIHVLRQQNAGASAARNRGAEHAHGDALMFMDADDVLGPEALEGLSAALARDPGQIAVGPWYCLKPDEGRWVRTRRNSPPRRHGLDDLAAWLTGWFHTPCSVLWSRDAFERSGGWDDQVTVNDDGDIMMRALFDGVRLVRASYGEAYYRRLPKDETSLSDTARTRSGLRSRLYVLQKIGARVEEQGMMPSYGPYLAEAFDRLSLDCDEHPEICRESLKCARLFGGPRWRRRLHTQAAYLHARFQRTWRRHVPFVRSIQVTVAPPVEIKFGQNSAPDARASGSPLMDAGDSDLPLVSVIIPTYNRRRRLRRALKSVLTQSYGHYEVIVVDDASTDDTESMVRGFGDMRIRYFRQATNQGVSAARNRGLREARGELIAFLDSDDEWMPDKLQMQVDRFGELSADVGLLYTAVEFIRDDGAACIDRPSHRGDLFEELLTVNVVYPTSGVMIRRDAASVAGYFDVDAPANEDWDYWLRIARHFEIEFVDEVLVRYSDESTPDRKSLALEDDIAARTRFFRKNAQDMKQAEVAAEFLLESARRQLVPDYWRPGTARSLLTEIVRLQGVGTQSLALFLRSMMPYEAYTWARGTWRDLLETTRKRRQHSSGQGVHDAPKKALDRYR